ncbi:exodeoxyribonuclease V subunit alpha [Leptospira fluminis]|uniref:Exodeoxyribonuclease V subunit alpha n=1 Tax=Leptospira fluminis TaxID=2484979 RepID=A0A4R9GQR2_9LEPT|nr:exodeoxyribonuclease V subunit alpha [Leptospira fluminis]TGK20030.1 exodeoxyribonuclease V subunit alpha [Leptospira fluminis]
MTEEIGTTDRDYIRFLTSEMHRVLPESEQEDLFQRNSLLLTALRTGSLGIPERKDSLSNKDNPFFRSRNGILYYRKTFDALTSSEEIFRSLLKRNPPESQKKEIPKILKEITERSPLVLRKEGLETVLCGEGEQREALEAALHSSFFVLTGGPGTGKTTVVTSLLRALVRLGYDPDKIGLAAPTGRAAQRLRESLENTLKFGTGTDPIDLKLYNLSTSTLHRLLRFDPNTRNYKYGKDFRLPYDVVVVDEVSMVDLDLMHSLLLSLPDTKRDRFRIVLLGDADQLPSVEAGAVLSDLAESISRSENFYRLKTGRRQTGNASTIFDAAKECISADTDADSLLKTTFSVQSSPSLSEVPEATIRDGFYRSEIDLKKDRIRFLSEYVEKCLLPGFSSLDKIRSDPRRLAEFLRADLNHTRILTILRQGEFGSEGINRDIIRLLLKQTKIRTIHLGTRVYFPGLPILIVKNDRSRGLFNGDTGLVLEFETITGETEMRAVFFLDGTIRDFALDTLPPHEPAFAITVHKSQGSEYDNVFILFPPDPSSETESPNELLRKEILYTALTRAKRKAILLAEDKNLSVSLKRKSERLTGFRI